MGIMAPVIIWVAMLIGICGVQMVVRQRIAESKQRVHGMNAEMARIETALVDLRAQEGAMLTPESLNQRLRSRGTALIKIPPRSHVLVEPIGRDEGLAMEAADGRLRNQ